MRFEEAIVSEGAVVDGSIAYFAEEAEVGVGQDEVGDEYHAEQDRCSGQLKEWARQAVVQGGDRRRHRLRCLLSSRAQLMRVVKTEKWHVSL